LTVLTVTGAAAADAAPAGALAAPALGVTSVLAPHAASIASVRPQTRGNKNRAVVMIFLWLIGVL
jgi:hypothetical protein